MIKKEWLMLNRKTRPGGPASWIAQVGMMAFLAGVIASVFLADWRWLVVGAVLLVAGAALGTPR